METGSPREEPVVLLVDDDAALLRGLSRGLLPLPARLQLAANGEAALAWLDAGGVPSACITDLRMGEVGGLEVLERVRARTPWCWCALHTGEPVEPGLLADGVVLLLKPMTVAEIRQQLLVGLAGVRHRNH